MDKSGAPPLAHRLRGNSARVHCIVQLRETTSEDVLASLDSIADREAKPNVPVPCLSCRATGSADVCRTFTTVAWSSQRPLEKASITPTTFGLYGSSDAPEAGASEMLRGETQFYVHSLPGDLVY